MKLPRNHRAVLLGIGSAQAVLAAVALWQGQGMVALAMGIAFIASALPLLDTKSAARGRIGACAARAARGEHA